MSEHHVVHIEFAASDLAAAGTFYRDVFDWKIEQMPEMNYATFETGNNVGGGFNPVADDYPAGTVIVYISTGDIDASLAKIEASGGKTVTPKTEIPGMGWFALFNDPTGNLVGLFTGMEG